MNKGFFLYI